MLLHIITSLSLLNSLLEFTGPSVTHRSCTNLLLPVLRVWAQTFKGEHIFQLVYNMGHGLGDYFNIMGMAMNTWILIFAASSSETRILRLRDSHLRCSALQYQSTSNVIADEVLPNTLTIRLNRILALRQRYWQFDGVTKLCSTPEPCVSVLKSIFPKCTKSTGEGS